MKPVVMCYTGYIICNTVHLYIIQVVVETGCVHTCYYSKLTIILLAQHEFRCLQINVNTADRVFYFSF